MLASNSKTRLALSVLLTATTAAFPQPKASPDAHLLSVQVQTVAQLPPNYNLENLAVRQSGEVLVTVINHPELYQVDPFTGHIVLAASLPGVTSTLDVVEVEKDIFYTDAGNFSLATLSATPGSFGLFKVDMRNFDATKPGSAPVTKVAAFPDGDFLNGMVVLNKSAGLILVADSIAGLVWKVDTYDGKVTKAIEDPSMQPAPRPGVVSAGINGIKIQDQALVFDNTDRGTLNTIPIKLDGTAAGPAKVLATGIPVADDFHFDVRGDVFIAQNSPADELGLVKSGDDVETVLASIRGGATAVQFGRTKADRKTLYVTSEGFIEEVNGKNITIGGRLSKVNVGVEGVSN